MAPPAGIPAGGASLEQFLFAKPLVGAFIRALAECMFAALPPLTWRTALPQRRPPCSARLPATSATDVNRLLLFFVL